MDFGAFLASMEDRFKGLEGITIKLIERHNQTDRTLAEVSERLARLEKQAEANYEFMRSQQPTRRR